AGELLSLDDRLVSTRQLHDGKATMTVQAPDASAWRRQLTPNNRLERTALLSARARRAPAARLCALAPRSGCWRAAAQPERAASDHGAPAFSAGAAAGT